MQLIISTTKQDLDITDFTDLGFDRIYASVLCRYQFEATIPDHYTIEDLEYILGHFDHVNYDPKTGNFHIEID